MFTWRSSFETCYRVCSWNFIIIDLFFILCFFWILLHFKHCMININTILIYFLFSSLSWPLLDYGSSCPNKMGLPDVFGQFSFRTAQSRMKEGSHHSSCFQGYESRLINFHITTAINGITKNYCCWWTTIRIKLFWIRTTNLE